jgi:hypothetical protein
MLRAHMPVDEHRPCLYCERTSPPPSPREKARPLRAQLRKDRKHSKHHARAHWAERTEQAR